MTRIPYHLTVWTRIQKSPESSDLPRRLHELFVGLAFEEVLLFPRSKKLPESETSWLAGIKTCSPYEGGEITFSAKALGGTARGRVILGGPVFEEVHPFSSFELDFSLSPDFSKSIFQTAEAVTHATLLIADLLGAFHGEVQAMDASDQRQEQVSQRYIRRASRTTPWSVEWITLAEAGDQPAIAALARARMAAPGSVLDSLGGFQALLLTTEPFSYRQPHHCDLLAAAEAAYAF